MTPTEFLAAADLERFIRFDRDIARLESTFNGIAADVPRMFDELARTVAIRSPGCRLQWARRHDELAWDVILRMPNHVCRAGIRVTPVRDGLMVWPLLEGAPAPGSREIAGSVRGANLRVDSLLTVAAVTIGALTACRPIARVGAADTSEPALPLRG